MSIPGHATPEGTQQFAEKFQSQYSQHAYSPLGRTNLSVSNIGFGTYRCHQEAETHRAALRLALQKGCNLIDTSANYTDGNAEVLIGDVLNREVVWENLLERENVVVTSKVGYIQWENMEIARGREQENNPFPEVVKYQEGLWHCIHPEFIEDQITRSLARMHLDTLDVYLLHNPEYFLSKALKNDSTDRETVEKEFYDRIRRAFIQMEKLAAEGLIRYYGISSNGFPLVQNSPQYVSLARVFQAYQDACLQRGITAEQGHFAVIQLPYNWLEPQAATLPNNEYRGKKFAVLDLARQFNLGVLGNRPLNAIHQNRLIRLASYGFDKAADYQDQLSAAIKKFMELENEILQIIDKWEINTPFRDGALNDAFRLNRNLQFLTQQLIDVSQFKQIVAYQIRPLVESAGETFLKAIPAPAKETAEAVIREYFRQLNQVIDIWLRHLDQQNYRQIAPLIRQFDEVYPHLSAELTISQKALFIAAGTPGISAALNGMRTPDYVNDSLGVLKTDIEFTPEHLFKDVR